MNNIYVSLSGLHFNLISFSLFILFLLNFDRNLVVILTIAFAAFVNSIWDNLPIVPSPNWITHFLSAGEKARIVPYLVLFSS